MPNRHKDPSAIHRCRPYLPAAAAAAAAASGKPSAAGPVAEGSILEEEAAGIRRPEAGHRSSHRWHPEEGNMFAEGRAVEGGNRAAEQGSREEPDKTKSQ